MRIQFVLIAEGSSDEALVPHLRELCRRAGAAEANGVHLNRQLLTGVRRLPDKLQVALREERAANLFFLHRDADSRDAERRYSEIQAAIEASTTTKTCLGIVPVQETEAWLLLDEEAIRRVAGNPDGPVRLKLPSPRTVERIANPKERLKEQLALASEHKGQRLKDFKEQFPTHRRLLLEQLPLDGPIARVPSWMRLNRDIHEAIGAMR